MIALHIPSLRQVSWLLLFAVILSAWTALFAMSIPDDLRASAHLFGSDFWVMLCTVTPDLAGFHRVFLMWALMSAAMMLPTAIPAFQVYDELSHSTASTAPVVLWSGYLLVWLGFSAAAATAQIVLFQADLVSGFGDSRSVVLSSVLLAVAGLYQFSPLKEACLKKCRAPMMFFMAHWQDGPWRMGLKLGAACLGCCWALMLLAFVGGVMSLTFMGLATLIMTLEKLPDIGRWINKPLGGVLLVFAGLVPVFGI